jgi:hypothetical protein
MASAAGDRVMASEMIALGMLSRVLGSFDTISPTATSAR